MAKAIIKYSDLIENDGGFEALVKDLEKVEATLNEKAKSLKGSIKLVDVADTKSLEKYKEEVEVLKKAYESLSEASKAVRKAEEERKEVIREQNKLNKEGAEAQEKNRKSLESFYIAQESLKNQLKEVNQNEKKGIISTQEAILLRGKYRNELKQTSKEITAMEKAVNDANKENEKENAIIKAKLLIQDKQVDTLQQISERMQALRLVVKNTNITTKEGREAVASMNAEIDQLSGVLNDNSDKFIQNKNNIGNYKESVIEAIEETGLLSTGVGVLDKGLNKLLGALKSNKKATDQNTEATNRNTGAMANLRKGAGALGTALKATGIVLFITLLASMFSIFKQGRAGVVRTEQALAVFGATTKVVINLLANIGKGLFSYFASLGSSFQNLGLRAEKMGLSLKKMFYEIDPRKTKDDVKAVEEEINKLTKTIDENAKTNELIRGEAWDKVAESVVNFKKDVENAKNSVKTSINGIEQAFVIGDKIRATKTEIIGLKKELQAYEVASDDATQGLRTMLEATYKAGEQGAKVYEKEIDLLKMQLQLANVKAKADLQAHGLRVSNMNVENGNLEQQIAFSKQLLSLNQGLSVTKNPLDDALLDESQNALNELMEKQNEYSAFTLDLAKKEREIKRDLFEQDLDLLIDLIDTEKNLSEQFVNDTAENFGKRVEEMGRFQEKFKEGTSKQMELFTRTAKDQGLDLDFKIDWKNDGSFDVFLGEQKLALDNIVELNEQLQGAKLSEIAINRFREFTIESRNAQRDFKDLNKALEETARKIKEITDEKAIDEKELENIKKFKESISSFKVGSFFGSRDKEKLSKELEKLEKERTKQEQGFEKERLENRIKAIDEEVKAVKKGSEDELNLLKERKETEIQIEQLTAEQIKNNLEEILSQKTKWEKFAEEVTAVLDKVFDKFSEIGQKQVDITEKNLQKQQDATERQRERAKEGLENTLAFEQNELAKREAEKIKAEKKLERLEKIKALWTSYNSNSNNKDVKNPLQKTLTDFAMLEVFSASFGEGGLVEDVLEKVPTNGRGITRGRSHNGRGGGIPVLIEGNEGFLNGKEVKNLGHENFYAIKELAGRGVVSPDLFKNQTDKIKTLIAPVVNDNSEVVHEIKELKNALKGIKSTNVDLVGVVDGVLEFAETITEGNKTIRNSYKVNKKIK